MTTRTPRSDARANREGILDAARNTLATDPHASVDVIARSAGLSRRTLYGHFDDRDALIRELIVIGAQRFNAIAESIADADARLALARLIEEMARTVVARTDAASAGAADLAVRTVLSIAGLSWREADALLTAHPDITLASNVAESAA